MAPDGGQVGRDRDAVAREHRFRPDAGQLQQLRRVDRPGRDQDFPPRPGTTLQAALAEHHAGRAPPLDHDAQRLRVQLHAQIGKRHDRPQIGPRRRHPQTVPGGDLVVRHAFRLGAVEVGAAREARLLAGVQETLAERVALARHVGDAQRPEAAAHRVAAGPERFRPHEPGQHVLPSPSRISLVAPVVEIRRQAAHVDHRVDRAGAAEHAPARPVAAAAVERRVGFRAVHPVDPRIVERPAVADRHQQRGPPVAAAGLQQQDGVRAVLGEPPRQHAAGRAAADDDVVEFQHPPILPPIRPEDQAQS